jgi:hypothetical protein
MALLLQHLMQRAEQQRKRGSIPERDKKLFFKAARSALESTQPLI